VIKLSENSNAIEAGAFIARKSDGTLLAQTRKFKTTRTSRVYMTGVLKLSVDEDISNCVIGAEAIWKKDDDISNVDIFKTSAINSLNVNFEYEHIYPKKEETVIKFGDEYTSHEQRLADNYANSNDRDNDHIIVTLYRTPDKSLDTDYICYFGKNPQGKPYFAVPGKGTIKIPNGITLPNTNYIESAYCYVAKIDENSKAVGGVIPIYSAMPNSSMANNAEHLLNKDDIAFTKYSNNSIDYSFIGKWNDQTADNTGNFQKIFYSYYLSILIKDIDGNIYSIIVSSDPGDRALNSSVTYKLEQTIAVMWGCIGKGTLIKTDNGDIAIENLHIGDKVVNPLLSSKTGNTVYSVITNVWRGIESSAMSVITTESGAVICVTQQHPMLTSEGIKPAGKLSAGNEVALFIKGKKIFEKIKSIELKQYDLPQEVFNLDLDSEEQCFAANDFCTGTNKVQNTIGEFNE
jgi:hypothetical protein